MPFPVFNRMPHIFWRFLILGTRIVSLPPPWWLGVIADCSKAGSLASGTSVCSQRPVHHLVANQKKKNPKPFEDISRALCSAADLCCPLFHVSSLPLSTGGGSRWRCPPPPTKVLPEVDSLPWGHGQLPLFLPSQRSLPGLEANAILFVFCFDFFFFVILRQESLSDLC